MLSVNLVFTHTKQKQANATQAATSLKHQSLPLRPLLRNSLGGVPCRQVSEGPEIALILLSAFDFVFVVLDKEKQKQLNYQS